MKLSYILSLVVTTLVCKASADECFADKYGVQCCEKTKMVLFIDDKIKWGLEDGHKCAVEPAGEKKSWWWWKRSNTGNNGKNDKNDKKIKVNKKKVVKKKTKVLKKKVTKVKVRTKQNKNNKTNNTTPVLSYMDKIHIDNICPEEMLVRRDDVTYPDYFKVHYYSTTTETERPMNIILPVGYDESKKYPVLYYLHGIMTDEDTMMEEPLGTIAISSNLLHEHKSKEMIIVVPNQYAPAPGTEVEPVLDQSYYDGYDNFINDLVNDIMPYMEEHYSIATGRENTAICGFSMGGRNALYIGYVRSDLFGWVGAFSPAPGITEATDMMSYHKGLLQPEELVAKYPPIVTMLSCGTSDTVVGTFPKEYHELLEQNKQEHVWYEIPEANHDLTAITTGLYNFIASVFGILN